MVDFLLGWFDTPLYLWSVKTILGFICSLIIVGLPITILSSIIKMINGDDNE